MLLTRSFTLIDKSQVLNLYVLPVNFLGLGSLICGREGYIFISITQRVAILEYKLLNSY
jgi:hypothetical protein